MHPDVNRPGDIREAYDRDKSRIIHSSAFRRLQGKTQVMGVGENDFHRTRLTHSIEVGQIGEGLLKVLQRQHEVEPDIVNWLPSPALMIAACYAHDLGHPPFGHGGERALHRKMVGSGGFEGNAQTLRILTKLEKYQAGHGINPTRRTVLAVLKYPVRYDAFPETDHQNKPPKCYYTEEANIVEWALEPFSKNDTELFRKIGTDGKPEHRGLDASIMECADDIAYAVHDLEDIIARKLVTKREVENGLSDLFKSGQPIGPPGNKVCRNEFANYLFECGSEGRKQFIGKLVNIFISAAKIDEDPKFEHPLLKFSIQLPAEISEFLQSLKDITYKLVVKKLQSNSWSDVVSASLKRCLTSYCALRAN
ncbi:anti-phage deoxyguanosine triphosphatase [Paeniroseomonas aquatica]|uniref:anti-phage deoxyguanosine triphosphatase n=1 Tax=Paeniroseomonas aquatica TaxID=373043 RepID=UPI00361F38DB